MCVRVFIFNYLAWSVADIWLLFGGFWCNSVNPELRLICFMHFNRANGFIRLAINTCLKLYAFFFLCEVVFTDRSFFHRRIVAKVQVYFFKGRVRSYRAKALVKKAMVFKGNFFYDRMFSGTRVFREYFRRIYGL